MPRRHQFEGVKAVFFDVYGTLFISAASRGDRGGGGRTDVSPIIGAMQSLGWTLQAPDTDTTAARWLSQAVRRSHAIRGKTAEYQPEVDMRVLWGCVLDRLRRTGRISGPRQSGDALRMMVEYEMRTKPVWPMPHALSALRQLKQKGLLLGIISNSQQITPLLFEALMGARCRELGFDPALCFWSYREGVAKPSPDFFRRAAETLARQFHIRPEAVIHVGNDLRNDVWAARQAKFGTVLFAGDRRSLRREEDPLLHGVRPDAVITTLGDLPRLIGKGGEDGRCAQRKRMDAFRPSRKRRVRA